MPYLSKCYAITLLKPAVFVSHSSVLDIPASLVEIRSSILLELTDPDLGESATAHRVQLESAMVGRDGRRRSDRCCLGRTCWRLAADYEDIHPPTARENGLRPLSDALLHITLRVWMNSNATMLDAPLSTVDR